MYEVFAFKLAPQIASMFQKESTVKIFLKDNYHDVLCKTVFEEFSVLESNTKVGFQTSKQRFFYRFNFF